MVLTPKLSSKDFRTENIVPQDCNTCSLQTGEKTNENLSSKIAPSKTNKDNNRILIRHIKTMRPKSKQNCLYYSQDQDKYWKNIPVSPSPLRRLKKFFISETNDEIDSLQRAASKLSKKARFYPQAAASRGIKSRPPEPASSKPAPFTQNNDTNTVFLTSADNAYDLIHPKAQTSMGGQRIRIKREKFAEKIRKTVYCLGGKDNNTVMQKIITRICTPQPETCVSTPKIQEPLFANHVKSISSCPKKPTETEPKITKQPQVKEKIKWYDKRPRLMINMYYRNNFAENSKDKTAKKKGKIPLTIRNLWNSAVLSSKTFAREYSKIKVRPRLSIPEFLRTNEEILNTKISPWHKKNVFSQNGFKTVRCILDFY